VQAQCRFRLGPRVCPWRTYERLRAKGEHCEMLALAGLAAWIERAKGSARG